ncbi:uncharacterized protein BJ171DRAFT_21128 [Polychytrium aggregatum]|uniref:uncharacterized protein n=1 Tax=Polychytrium aggregatum TaxID=110093 RepID=UPI0022FDB365|nr:uncharacterized protein BJ171DRAFT_591598 [Polychytrium aggregatum]XP_052961930.1 uncharacterized protein BJ171DRAFT_21128 [Polychytrium aggregatum]KAI9190616.1 hypothetical protein BJ171DRAFT_591598 [Polychytrium aggregatum]KAI9192992.1 hypothetical protein BJ171DRAFT_21128 [Polychytrium aggregatum]
MSSHADHDEPAQFSPPQSPNSTPRSRPETEVSDDVDPDPVLETGSVVRSSNNDPRLEMEVTRFRREIEEYASLTGQVVDVRGQVKILQARIKELEPGIQKFMRDNGVDAIDLPNGSIKLQSSTRMAPVKKENIIDHLCRTMPKDTVEALVESLWASRESTTLEKIKLTKAKKQKTQ